MSQVVREADRLHQILVRAERPGDAAPDLGDLQGMRQPGAVVIALVVDEDLSLIFQPPESGRMQDAVPIFLENGAVIRSSSGCSRPLNFAAFKEPDAGLKSSNIDACMEIFLSVSCFMDKNNPKGWASLTRWMRMSAARSFVSASGFLPEVHALAGTGQRLICLDDRTQTFAG
jgi:hypothetical protein